MKISRELLWSIVGGLVGAGVVAVGIFVVVYGPYFIDYLASETTEATVQNVFQQDIANDRGAIEQIIGPASDYELQNFQMDYTKTGEIRGMNWTVQKRHEDGSCEFYSIGRMESASEYRIDPMNYEEVTGAGDSACTSDSYMPFDQFLNVMTSDLIQGTSPQENYEFVFLKVKPVLTMIESSAGQDIFAWDGSRLQGPIHSGKGYLVEQHKFEEGNFTDRKMFLIDGTYQ